MTGFSTSWLDLRETADHAALDRRLLEEAARVASQAAEPLVVDLACGTGSMMRVLGPMLKVPVAWRLVDDDPALLAEAERRAGGPVEIVRHDLSALAPLPVKGASLITMAALVDLVSEAWLQRMVAMATSNRSAVYATLAYDGTTTWSDPHPLDAAVLEAFNRDQRRDKGFGPALGPRAPQAVADALNRAGYRVTAAESPWRLGSADGALVAALARGIADAVTTEGSLEAEAVGEWLAFRLEHAGSGTCTVGHVDVLGLPG